jgi:Leucine-rich repeat (LRR) protein
MAAPENDPSDGGASSRSGYSFDASSRAPSTWDEDDLITEITEEVLDMCTDGKSWRVQFHRHMTFRSARFRLWTLDGLLLAPIDLSGLESLDVSNNRLKELDCIAGTSATLKKEGCVQGQLRFQSLRVLKARRNQLEAFEAAMPTLKELDLGHNRLKKLPAMAGLSNLEVLVFSHNQMSGSWDSLVRLQKLKKLDLSQLF